MDEAFDNLIDKFDDALSQLLEAYAAEGGPIPIGRMTDPDKANERIGRYVRWFYLNHFEKVSIRSLTKEYHDQLHGMDCKNCDYRPTIRRGVGEAKRLLGLTRFTY